MSLKDSLKFSVGLERLGEQDANGKRVYAPGDDILVCAQPLNNEEVAINGGSFSRSYKFYADFGTDVLESDRLTVPVGNIAGIADGVFEVQSIETYKFGRVTHIKLYVERPKDQ